MKAVGATLAVLLLAGCLTPADRTTGVLIEDVEGIIEIECVYEVQAYKDEDWSDNYRVKALPPVCGGPDFREGKQTELEVTASGAISSGSGRIGDTITVTVHYPTSVDGRGSASDPYTSAWYVAKGSEGEVRFVLEFPVTGTGTYTLHHVLGCSVHAEAWAPWAYDGPCSAQKHQYDDTTQILVKEDGVHLS